MAKFCVQIKLPESAYHLRTLCMLALSGRFDLLEGSKEEFEALTEAQRAEGNQLVIESSDLARRLLTAADESVAQVDPRCSVESYKDEVTITQNLVTGKSQVVQGGRVIGEQG